MLKILSSPAQGTSFGAELCGDGAVRFRMWAPAHDRMFLAIDDASAFPMERTDGGFHEVVTRAASAGSRYRYVLPDGARAPDPASRYQPEDVHGPSVVADPHAYVWQTKNWCGRPWHEAVIYELHVGTFTEEGTFRAAVARLDHLQALGVTAIELMPIADFPGRRNWGYDGVFLYAPDASYGPPEDLKGFIDAAHARGLMVFLDVVYNHFGPEGNYFPLFAPSLYTRRHKTPWGDAINYDGPDSGPVRAFMIQNALYWLTEYRFDGLRLDAVHSIVDDSPKHLLTELAEEVRSAFSHTRHVHLLLENEENEAHYLERDPLGGEVAYTAQWNDDVHHSLHTAITEEDTGYYAEYKNDVTKLGRSLAEGFAFQGEVMAYRGSPRGQPSKHLPPPAFVSFVQNHDQIGNRAFGDRLAVSVDHSALRAAVAICLLAPQVPMLFMGEEWGCVQPFPFFCDFEPELAEAVREGRRAEFAKFPEFQGSEQRERIPDPTAPETFLFAKLRWEDADLGAHAEWRDWYQRVLAVRHAEIVPRLVNIRDHSGRYQILDDLAVRVRWSLAHESELTLTANLKAVPVAGMEPPHGRVLWSEGSTDSNLGPWSVLWTLSGGTN